MTIIPQQIYYQGQHILYDAARVANFEPRLFEPDYLSEQSLLIGQATGRGQTLFFSCQNQNWVLRHYRRGGAVAKLLTDSYLWLGLNRSRAWREWHLLSDLYAQGFPVPKPVAARVQRNGMMARMDLITVRIENSDALSSQLSMGPLAESEWRHIGATVRRFHDEGVRHADLNVNNILLADNQAYLIDFDRGSIGRMNEKSKHQNLQRLLRSLRKLKRLQANLSFSDRDWQEFMVGYRNE